MLKIDFDQFLCYLVIYFQNQFLPRVLIMGEVKFFYFLLESLCSHQKIAANRGWIPAKEK